MIEEFQSISFLKPNHRHLWCVVALHDLQFIRGSDLSHSNANVRSQQSCPNCGVATSTESESVARLKANWKKDLRSEPPLIAHTRLLSRPAYCETGTLDTPDAAGKDV